VLQIKKKENPRKCTSTFLFFSRNSFLFSTKWFDLISMKYCNTPKNCSPAENLLYHVSAPLLLHFFFRKSYKTLKAGGFIMKELAGPEL